MGNGGKRKDSDRSELTALCQRVAARQGKVEVCRQALKECEETCRPVSEKIPVAVIEDMTARRQAEERLKVSEEKYRTLVEGAPFGLSIMDPDETFEYVNPKFTEIFGYTLEDIPDKETWFKRAYPDVKYRKRVARIWREDLDECMRIGEIEPRSFVVRCRDGQDKIIRFTAVGLKGGKQILAYEDITEQRRNEQELAYRCELERLITCLSADFINRAHDRIDEGIKSALKAIGRFVNADRSYMILLSKDGKRLSRTHEWCAKGIPSYRHEVKDIPIESFPWAHGKILRGEMTYLSRIDDLPPDACAEREKFHALGIRSILLVPVFVGGRCMGGLGFDAVREEREWSEEIISLLTITGGIISNALDRKRIEEALSENEERYRSIFDQARDGIVLIDSETGLIVDCNRAFEQQTGIPSTRLKQMKIWDLRPPERIEAAKRVFLECREKRMAGPEEIEFERHDQRVVHVEYLCKRVFLRGRNFLQCIFRDITDRRKAQMMLTESEEKYRSLVENSNDGICILQDGVVKFANAHLSGLLGYTLEEGIGSSFQWYVSPEELPKVQERYASLMTGEKDEERFETILVSRDGQHIETELNISVTDYEGRRSVLVFIRDITERKQAERALRASEERLKDAERIGRIGYWELDTSTGNLLWSEQVFRLFGRNPAEGSPKLEEALACYFQRDARHVEESLRRAITSGDPLTIDYTVALPSGKSAYHTTTVNPVRDRKGRVVKLIGTVQDITDRKRAEEEIRKFKTIFDRDTHGNLIADLKGNLVYVNESFACLHGYTPDELIGKSCSQLHPDGRFDHVKTLENLLSQKGGIAAKEVWHRRKDGSIFPALMNVMVINDENGIPSMISATVMDISERHRAEEILRQSERKYRELVENMSDVIYRVDENGTITYVSPAVEALLGYTPEEVENHSFARFIYREDLPRCMKSFQHSLENSVTSGEYRVVTRSGSTRWIRTSTRPVMQGERVIAVEGMLTDITESREAEELLRESEERYRTFLRNFQGIAFRQHFDFTPVFFHGNCEGITGYREEDFTGGRIRWNDIVHPEDLAMFYETGIRLHGTPDQAIERQYRIIRKDGRIVWVHEFIRNICNDKGRPVMLQGAVYDITDHKLADQALQQSQNELSIRNRIANIFLTLSDEAIYSEMLKVVLDAEESPLGYFGYIDERGDFVCPTLSKHVWEKCCMPGKDIRFPRESWRGLWGKSLVEQSSFIMNTPLTVPEGHLPISRALVVPVVHKGEVIGQIAVANRDQDYSESDLGLLETIAHSIAPILHARLQVERQEKERSRTETELFLTKSHMEYLLRSVPAVIYSRKANEDWSPTFVSENILTQIGYTREDFLADPGFWINHVHPEDAQRVLAGLERIIEEGVLIHEYRFLNSDGVYHWLRDDCRLVRDAAGVPLEIVGSLIDITEHKRLEEQFYHAQKMEAIGILAGGIAHDFNNLLQAIMGYSDSILLDGDDPQQHIQDIEQIKKATTKAASLTRQLLAFSRKQSIDPGLLDINALITDMGAMLGRIIGEDIDLTEMLQPDLRSVKGDQGQMEQVIMNLVVNARDAMPKGGRLILGTENVTVKKEDCKGIPHAEPGEFVCLSVEDTGTGIDRRIMDRIFEPFFSTKHKGEGTGLGLSTVYGIVKQHGGWITVESIPGEGSRFRIFLPCSYLRAGDSWPETAPVSDLKGNGERILIVEDEVSVRELAKRALCNAGYVVFDASCVRDALSIFEKEGGTFDLVLSDVVLPDQSGLFLTRRLKTDAASLKIILSSGYTDEKSQTKIIREEGIDFLQKPYTLLELLKCIRRTIQTPS